MENNKLIAYSSKIQKIILLIVWIIVIIIFSLLIILVDEVRLFLIITDIVTLSISGVVVINILRNNSSIAFEIQDDKLVLYKRTGVVSININEIVPTVACPHLPENTRPASELHNIKIDQVVIGSCTNGSIEDMKAAADILRGKHVPEDLRVVVVPATNYVFEESIRLGYIEDFIKAGCVISHPCCGLCCGMPYGLMYDDERILLTANRNFIGRQGTKKTLSYLSSPKVAAATALTGYVTDPRTLG